MHACHQSVNRCWRLVKVIKYCFKQPDYDFVWPSFISWQLLNVESAKTYNLRYYLIETAYGQQADIYTHDRQSKTL